MNSCVINGTQCTSCCRTIHANMRQQLRKVHRDGLKTTPGSDLDFARKHWKPMSRRLAKKKNPYSVAVSDAAKTLAGAMFFSCSKVGHDGCTVYESRPKVCSQYPRYGRTEEEWNALLAFRRADYRADCTQYIPTQVIASDASDEQPKTSEAAQ